MISLTEQSRIGKTREIIVLEIRRMVVSESGELTKREHNGNVLYPDWGVG